MRPIKNTSRAGSVGSIKTIVTWIAAFAVCLVAAFFLIGNAKPGILPDASPAATSYRNEKYRFSFALPSGYTASAFEEAGGQTILIRSPQNDTVGQLHVSETPLPVPISPELVRRDMGETRLFDLRPFSLAGSQPIAGAAFSFDPAVERKASEVWFVFAGVLYQWTISAGFDELVGEIIQSLQW